MAIKIITLNRTLVLAVNRPREFDSMAQAAKYLDCSVYLLKLHTKDMSCEVFWSKNVHTEREAIYKKAHSQRKIFASKVNFTNTEVPSFYTKSKAMKFLNITSRTLDYHVPSPGIWYVVNQANNKRCFLHYFPKGPKWKIS